ncbi:MAG: CBS domain-containing protein [Bryobacterales bacterium]|nr:CBS domain-containing protein [Bryobacterales bacterium]
MDADRIAEGNSGNDANPEESTTPTPIYSASEAGIRSSGEDSLAFDDPTYRIGGLPVANKNLVTVNENDSICTAITLMLRHDFSQLPVMRGEREVKGIVTWKSIACKYSLDRARESVGDCSEDARIVDSHRTLFEAIPTIVDYGYVLVRDRTDRRITGIVTSSDLSRQFQTLSEPFLLIREIELHVRQLLERKLVSQDLERLGTPSGAASKPAQRVDELTFGEYVRLVQDPEIWEKLGLKIDRRALAKLLEEVRTIRNDVMHFDPDPMTSEELDILRGGVRLIQEAFE